MLYYSAYCFYGTNRTAFNSGFMWFHEKLCTVLFGQKYFGNADSPVLDCSGNQLSTYSLKGGRRDILHLLSSLTDPEKKEDT